MWIEIEIKMKDIETSEDFWKFAYELQQKGQLCDVQVQLNHV